mmetsp:Transcript_20184/g.43860  ORF Transcript_20184/g.43860 Transcript_20184/m.43860 type:complete len:525 (+) Transcript_20184:129-1703(+)|eukprot:CAMPEP_0172297850 /NCGR_PEP_ID=MMETSP1058-20130122/725_1 /TAXON_ID=83371 /ORGANISM="Detonula confervacea, Strain CCMP 353" /LENGTH=524 /DNA_ID=CAMNT_0013007051 /DNA_START=76 /DNA_END=1650 /DNA_ORIENTATION=-
MSCIAARIRSGETTSLQVVTDLIDRIELHEGTVKAFVALYRDEALALARTLDGEAAAGIFRGRLHGVPFATKDLFRLASHPTRAGFSFEVGGWPAGAENASAVQVLLDEGAILLGVTQLTEGAWTEYNAECLADGSCPPQNPFAPGVLWPGDSSSGCGTGAAAGFFPACLATDTSGSIRNPCMMNSLLCVKPRRSVIGRDGVWPLSQRLDTVGVIGRHASEVASFLQTYDASGRDYNAMMTATASKNAVKNMRIGVDWTLIAQAEQELPNNYLGQIIRNAEKAFREDLNVQIVDISGKIAGDGGLAPLMDELAASSQTTIAHAVASNYKDLYRTPYKEQMSSQMTSLIEIGNNVTVAEYENIDAIAESFRDRWLTEFGQSGLNLDAVMLFVWGRPAPLDSEIPAIVMSPSLFATAVRYMVPFNYADLPLVVVPQKVAGKTCKDLFCGYADRPRSFQLVGTSSSLETGELRLLQLSKAYEQVRGELVYRVLDKEGQHSSSAASCLSWSAIPALSLLIFLIRSIRI